MSNHLVRLKASVWQQARSSGEFLPTGVKAVRSFFSSPFRIGLIVLFSALFLPHVFIMVEDISLVGAYEVDPGSIVASIISLYHRASFYNMNIPYHSQFYGWTYFFINFLLVAPVYLLMMLNVLQGYSFFLISIRLIFFLIGLASLLAFFEVSRRSLKHELLAFVAGLLYIASPAVSKFFYFLHPETTGLLFLFLGILCLFRFHEGSATDLKWYAFGLLCLVLSALSKQVFLLTAFPVLFLFLYIYCYHHDVFILRFLLSKEFWKIFIGSIVFSIFIFFIINPYAFLQPKTFLAHQIVLFSTHSQGAYTEAEATKAWLDVLKSMPILTASILASLLSLLIAGLFCRDQKVGRMFYGTNLLAAIFFTFFNVITVRFIIYDGYLAPVYPFFILNILAIALFVTRKWNMEPVRISVFLVLTLFVSFVLVKNFSATLPLQWNRLQYKDSVAYKTYQYINTKIPKGQKIAYDQFVAIPFDRTSSGCQYWQGCGTDYIEKFHPDYVILAEDWTFGGVTLPERARLIKYINDHHFILIDKIVGKVPGYTSDFPLQVWKKPKK